MKAEQALIIYRSFRNSDPPALARMWSQRPPTRGLLRSISTDLLDELVLCKSYFDRDGIILAIEDGMPIGYVHAGFGPTACGTQLDHQQGVVSMLMVNPHDEEDQIAQRLLDLADEYLRSRGAVEVHAMGTHVLYPFYLGLYGGAEIPGVLQSDTERLRWFNASGYQQVDRVHVWQRELTGYRAQIMRSHIQIGRFTTVNVTLDPSPKNWWEACTKGCLDQVRVDLRPRQGGPPIACATFWNMDAFVSTWGNHVMGLSHIEVESEKRREGLATYLVGQYLRQVSSQGVTRVEGHARESNQPSMSLLEKLQFIEVDQGSIMRKSLVEQ